MEFGTTDKDIFSIDHRLPPDGDSTGRVLQGSNAGGMIHVGLTRWGMKEWCGNLYPDRTKSADFLKHYAEKFNSIELNSSFFAIPSLQNIVSWKEKIAESGNREFLFIPKASKEITHFRMLKDCGQAVNNFVSAVDSFGENLGPIFFQMGEKFGTQSFDRLEPFFKSLPAGHQYFFEVRNENWFSSQDSRFKLFNLMVKYNIGSIITDTSGRRDALHMELTTKNLFVRFVGNGGDYMESDMSRINNWIGRISQWKEKGLENVFFFVHVLNEAESPILAKYVIAQMNKHLGAGLKPVDIKL